MKINFLFTRAIIYIMAFGILKAQNLLNHQLSPLGAKEPDYYIDEGKYIARVIEKHKATETNTLLLQEYALHSLKQRLEFISQGYELEDWKEAEAYVARVAGRLGYNKQGDSIKIKFVRDPAINASAYEDGTVFLNVGIMSELNSEAELALLLGHEIAHVNLGHNYNSYKSYRAYLQEVSVSMVIGGFAGLLARKLAAYSFSRYSISQETAADESAMAALQNSCYSTRSAGNLFRHFKYVEDLLNKRTDRQNYHFIKTHPATDKRVHMMESAASQETTGKSLFVEDSTYFYKLKRRCTDEATALLFFGLRFEDCIEYSYKQHLKYPTDNFYLFFLRQSLLRLSYDSPHLMTKQFITHRYTEQNKDKTFPISLAYSKFYKNKPLSFVVRQSIFFNHEAILNLNDNTLEIENGNQALTSHDTLEFINNEDALDYFTREAKNQNCVTCLAETQTVDTAAAPLDLVHQIYYSRMKFLQLKPSNRPNLFVVARYHNSDYSALFNSPNAKGSMKQLYWLIQHDTAMKKHYKTPADLSFGDRNSLRTYFYKVMSLLPDPEEKGVQKAAIINSKYIDCQNLIPELADLLIRNELDKINFLSVHEVVLVSQYGMFERRQKIMNCYTLDFRTNTLGKYSRNLGEVDDSEILLSANEAFSILNKKIAKPQ